MEALLLKVPLKNYNLSQGSLYPLTPETSNLKPNLKR